METCPYFISPSIELSRGNNIIRELRQMLVPRGAYGETVEFPLHCDCNRRILCF